MSERPDRSGPLAARGEERTFAFTELAPFSFAIEATAICEVLPSGGESSYFDLAAFVGATDAPAAAVRRVVVIDGGTGPTHVRIGPELDMEVVKPRQIYALPSVIAGPRVCRTLSAVIRRQSGISFVISPLAILAAALQAATSSSSG